MTKHEMVWFGISSVIAIASLALQIIEAKNRHTYIGEFPVDIEFG